MHIKHHCHLGQPAQPTAGLRFPKDHVKSSKSDSVSVHACLLLLLLPLQLLLLLLFLLLATLIWSFIAMRKVHPTLCGWIFSIKPSVSPLLKRRLSPAFNNSRSSPNS